MRTRLAQHDDLPAILAISNRAAMETIANFAVEPESLEHWQHLWQTTHEKFPWFVAETESEDQSASGDIVGFSKASPWQGRCAYQFAAEVAVYVKPEYHGMGMGTELYERLFSTLQKQGYRSALAMISLPNASSVRVHERFGMQQIGTLQRIGWKFNAWHDVGIWQVVFDDSENPPDAIKSVQTIVK